MNLVKLIPNKFPKFKPKPDQISIDERVMNMLTAIEHYCQCATQEHANLFRQTVEDLMDEWVRALILTSN